MYQSILMYTDVHEGAEFGDVGDNPGKFHTNLQIRHGIDSILETENLKGLPWVSSRFGDFIHDVLKCGQTDSFRNIIPQDDL